MNNNTNKTKMKVCKKCARELPATTEYFWKDMGNKSGLRARCGDCMRSVVNTVKEEYKECTNCGERLPATTEHFYKDKTKRNGLRSQCKECICAKLRHAKPDSEVIREGFKKCTACNTELLATTENFSKKKNGKYGLDSRCKKCVGEYRKINKERIKEYHKLNYVKNKDEISKRNSEWHGKNKNSLVIRKQRRRARMHNLPATLTVTQWIEMKDFFNRECAYCGMSEEKHFEKYNEQLHQDHFVPLNNEGEYTHDNIMPACRSCNASKHAEDFFEWYPTYKYYSKKREKKILEYLGYKSDGVQQLSIL